MSSDSTKENFWKWFTSNQSKLEDFINDPNRDYAIYHEMTEELQKFSELLYPEITVNDDKYVLIITPNGIDEGVEPTREIVAAAPPLPNWEFVRFRQPMDDVSLEQEGLHYESTDIEILPEIDKDENKVNVLVFIRNMNKDPKAYQTLAFLYMDHILGEFNVITRVGYIDFKHLDEEKSVSGSINLTELRKLIEDNLY
jgi:hypothetical protein